MSDTTDNDLVRVTVADGKYTFGQRRNGTCYALRYGESWREDIFDGLTLAMAHRIEELQAKLAGAVAECERIGRLWHDAEAKLAQQDDDDFYPATAGDDPIWLGGVEYITKSRSDDLVQAAIAAKLREAANIACASFDGEIGYDDILALITPDAQAALDRYVKERSDELVVAERDKSIKAVRTFFGDSWYSDEWTMEELAAAIRDNKE